MVDGWRDDIAKWHAPFLGLLGDRRRARICSGYVECLIGHGDRKGGQPMVMRAPRIGYV